MIETLSVNTNSNQVADRRIWKKLDSIKTTLHRYVFMVYGQFFAHQAMVLLVLYPLKIFVGDNADVILGDKFVSRNNTNNQII